MILRHNTMLFNNALTKIVITFIYFSGEQGVFCNYVPRSAPRRSLSAQLASLMLMAATCITGGYNAMGEIQTVDK